MKSQFLQRVLDVGMDVAHDEEVVACYERLREMYIASGYAPDLEVQEEEPTDCIVTVSPVSIFEFPLGEQDPKKIMCQ